MSIPHRPLAPTLLTLLVLSVGTVLLPLRVAQAATITVTTTADELDTNGACSLREAIRAANTNARVGACAAGSTTGIDTITLPAGTVVLTRLGIDDDTAQTGDLDITSTITIKGAGAAKTIIDGNGTDRVLDVLASGKLTLSGVTVRGGAVVVYGTGIRNAGTFTATNTTIAGNSNWSDPYAEGGGLYTSGTATISNSTLQDNKSYFGGGIKNDGTLTLTNVTLFRNRAGESGGGVKNVGTLTVRGSAFRQNQADDGAGGAIDSRTTLTMDTSTMSGNRSTDYGAAVSVSGTATIQNSTINGNSNDFGGAVTNHGQATIRNTTISGNTSAYGAGGAVHNTRSGTLRLESATISANTTGGLENNTTGGLEYNGQITLVNTIVAGNTLSGSYPDRDGPDCVGPVELDGANVIGDTHACTLSGAGTVLTGDAKLGALQNNGGTTWTHALLSGSPAIDAGTTCPAKDQRGITRPRDGNGDGVARCDIGAVEH